MPIKGLSDRGLGFPEIGQIRKGAAKTGNRPGPDLNYFRVVFDERELKAAETFQEIYGKEPTWFRVILPFDEIDRMWEAWMEAYTAGRMVARTDGEYYIYLIDTKTGEILVKNGIDIKTGQPRPFVEGKPVGFYKDNSGKDVPIFCKPSGRLKVIIPELARAAYMTVLTTSIHDIVNISDQLRAFQTLNGGRLAGIPLIVRRRPRSISTPNPDGTRVRRVKWLISIEADPEWVKARLQETKRLALPGNGLALPAPSGELSDEEPPTDGLETDHDEDELDGDIQEGEFTQEAEQEAEPQPEQAVPSRPYSLETLKTRLVEFAKQYHGKPTEKQIGLIVMLMEKAFAGKDNAGELRHDLQFALFGREHINEVEGPVLFAALHNWLKPVKDSGGDYSPDPMAVKEINQAVSAALVAEGQTQLF